MDHSGQPITYPAPTLPSSGPSASTTTPTIAVPAPPNSSSSQVAGPSFTNGHAEAGPSQPRPLEPIDVGRQEVREEWDKHVAGRKRRWRALGFNEHQQKDLEGVALSHRMALLQDQIDVLYPAAPTAFTSTEDAIQRLLPYHIYQLWDAELDKTGHDEPPESIAERRQIETNLASRIDKVSERYFKIRRREGTQPSHLPNLVEMLRMSKNILNADLARVQEQHRLARNEWNIIESRRTMLARKEAADKAAADAAAKRQSDLARADDERKRLEQQQLLRKHQEQQAALLAKNNAKATAATPAKPAVPAAAAAPTPDAKAKANGTPSGRARGRPRKVDPMEQASGGNTATDTSPAAPAANGSVSVSSTPSAPSAPNGSTSAAAVASTPGSGANASAPESTPKGPISISVPIPLISHFVSLGILKVPVDPTTPTPGTILRTTTDKKNVIISINLASCTKTQLQGMAKALNVKISTPSGTPAPGPGGGATTTAARSVPTER